MGKIPKTGRMILNSWRGYYRYNGGLAALVRCSFGTRRLLDSSFSKGEQPKPRVDCVTFSVVSKMTALWALFIHQAINTQPFRVLIGDCSGRLHRYVQAKDFIVVLPLLNYHHGEKLDIFMNKVCQAEYVVVTDDDIFWLDTIPWQWAVAQMESDPRIAVASLLPKKQLSSVLKNKVPLPMGSCFVVRRKTWLEEELSFKVVIPPPSEGYDWLYDTGEFAQIELYRRGHKIQIAPPEIQAHFAAFEGISSWTLKIQKNSGDILENIAEDPKVRPEKALRTIYMSRGLAELVARYIPGASTPHLTRPDFLDRAEKSCAQFIPETQAKQIRASVQEQIARLKQCLEALTAEKQP